MIVSNSIAKIGDRKPLTHLTNNSHKNSKKEKKNHYSVQNFHRNKVVNPIQIHPLPDTLTPNNIFSPMYNSHQNCLHHPRLSSSLNCRKKVKNGRTVQSMKEKPFDKEHLLQMIEQQQYRNMEKKYQNYILNRKAIKKAIGLTGSNKNWSQNQVRLMIESIKNQNQELCQKLREKKEEICGMKKKISFTNYMESINYYQFCKNELKRLKNMIKQKNRQKRQQRKARRNQKKARNCKKGQLLEELNEKVAQNTEMYEQMMENENIFRNSVRKIRQKIQNKEKLLRQVRDLQQKLSLKGYQRVQYAENGEKQVRQGLISVPQILNSQEQSNTSQMNKKQRQYERYYYKKIHHLQYEQQSSIESKREEQNSDNKSQENDEYCEREQKEYGQQQWQQENEVNYSNEDEDSYSDDDYSDYDDDQHI